MPVPAPASGILFFACPKKSIQKKRHPAFRLFPALLVFDRDCSKAIPWTCKRRAASLPRHQRAVPVKYCDARGGITGPTPNRIRSESPDYRSAEECSLVCFRPAGVKSSFTVSTQLIQLLVFWFPNSSLGTLS